MSKLWNPAVAAYLIMSSTAWIQPGKAQDLMVGDTTALSAPAAMRFARLPEGLVLDVVLDMDFHTATLLPGSTVVTHTVCNIALPSGEVLPAGTRIFADVVSFSPDGMWGPVPMRLQFERMELPNGTEFPVSISILSGDRRMSSLPLPPRNVADRYYPIGMPLSLELNTAAQIAVTGTTL
jgi:hypothetical protein